MSKHVRRRLRNWTYAFQQAIHMAVHEAMTAVAPVDMLLMTTPIDDAPGPPMAPVENAECRLTASCLFVWLGDVALFIVSMFLVCDTLFRQPANIICIV